MDYTFSRRFAAGTGTVDLDVLLATIGATQAASPTARAQQRLIAQDKVQQHDNPRLALFADPERGAPTDFSIASFAPAFSLRQPK
ncbi:MAG: hypothetical protein ABI898_05220 [Sphingomonadales bacterium]